MQSTMSTHEPGGGYTKLSAQYNNNRIMYPILQNVLGRDCVDMHRLRDARRPDMLTHARIVSVLGVTTLHYKYTREQTITNLQLLLTHRQNWHCRTLARSPPARQPSQRRDA